jgi:hypothetical protein
VKVDPVEFYGRTPGPAPDHFFFYQVWTKNKKAPKNSRHTVGVDPVELLGILSLS